MTSLKHNDDLNISLEPHLLLELRPLQPIIPADLAQSLAPYTASSPPPTIPYSVLYSVSQWVRTKAGLEALASQDDPLDPHAYSMVALLAGAITSPERHFGTYVPPPDSDKVAAAKIAERKGITALINAFLSVIGSGIAVYWASGRLRWKNEWRVLLSLFAAVVVAVAEAVLYLIWQSRRSNHLPKRARPDSSRLKKETDHDGSKVNPGDKPATIINTSVEEQMDGNLRRRQ